MNKLTETFTLSNGVEIPVIGYGTWQTPHDGTTKECVKMALKAGYRHIDTAFAYGNEDEVGLGIKESGIPREEIFVTTKHWITDRGYEETIAAVEKSLELLGLDYIDLYLIHWPCVEKVTEDWKKVNAETWRGFEKMYKDGKIKAIGVSNFEKKHIEALYESCEIKPMVNQLEFHPGYTQLENIRWNQNEGILVEAWSPLGSGAVLKDETLNAIAKKYNKNVGQICVKFALQNGILPLPKSTNEGRMASNAEVFDFEISAEDMETLMNMPLLGFSGFVPEEAPADALVNGN
ncbi:MAG: aldo/keto reductase [Clostridia bacterium]|nr:aldo/keto reductase [Clostridia bacterium]